MAKTEKPFLVKLFLGLLYTVLTLALIFGGIWVFFKIKYDINLISTLSQLKVLQQEIKEEEKFDNLQTDADKQDAMNVVNACIDGLIIKEGDEYKFKDSNFNISSLMKWDLELTDKNIGAVLNIYMSLSSGGNAVGGEVGAFSPKLIQIKFLSYDAEKQTARINSVVKIETKNMKEKMGAFPLNMISNKIPDNIYISSTCSVAKLEGKFNYEITPEDLTINNLDANQSAEFLTVINLVVKVGSAKELNQKLSDMLINGMIGKGADCNNGEKINGFAIALENLGSSDFKFIEKDKKIYFVIVKKTIV